ncbi:MAG TPA: prolyl oligopeptidase family serine peptidase, partial [Bacteroidales bacterium]|nr:prolyl oligopeptidase family serine peptidase [Bacteroidales bacterium]
YLAFAENKIKAAVPIISTPDFMSVLNNLNLIEEIERLQSQGIMGTGSDFDGYKERVSQYNPIKHYEKMKDTPLLMLCGENDNITFPEGAEKIYGLLKPIVSDKEALKYVSYPGVGHNDTFQMNYQMMTWMKKYL